MEQGGFFYNAQDLSRAERRSLVLHILYSLECKEGEETLEACLQQYQEHYGVIINDDDQIIFIVGDILKNMVLLDTIIEKNLRNWKIERINTIVRLILRYAFWELLTLKSDAALVINEAVELAKGFAEQDSYKFVNGILDTWVKQQTEEQKNCNND